MEVKWHEVKLIRKRMRKTDNEDLENVGRMMFVNERMKEKEREREKALVHIQRERRERESLKNPQNR